MKRPVSHKPGESENSGYYRPKGVNPNWYDIWTEQVDAGVPPEEILDELCRLACGIDPCGPSDECQRYAEHIHAHLIAAFKIGQHTPNP